MYKGVKRVLSIILTLTLFVSTVVTAHAEDVQPEELLEIRDYNVMTAYNCETKTDFNESSSFYVFSFENYATEHIVPMEIEKPGMLLMLLGQSDSNYISMKTTLYSDAECREIVGSSTILNSDDWYTDMMVNIKSPGLYYFKYELTRNSKNENPEFAHQLRLIVGGERLVKNKSQHFVYQDTESESVFYKFKLKKPCLVSFNLYYGENEENNAYIQLMDNKKNTLTNQVKLSNPKPGNSKEYTHYYALPKGTYYLEAKLSCGFYELFCNISTINDNSGTSKTKATAINSKSPAKGYLLNTDKKSSVNWYKVAHSGKKPLRINLSYNVDGKIKIEICDSDGKVLKEGSKIINTGSATVTLYSNDQLKKGTYYIKVYKNDSESSGNYSVEII